jgi:hypothetical protein
MPACWPVTRRCRLHFFASLTDPFDSSIHGKQLILAKQLIEHGTNVNAVSIPNCETPLHIACHSDVVTNLDFLEVLLEAGADPNTKNSGGLTPLIIATPDAPGAAKFLMNWPSTEVNITTRSGASFLAMVRSAITSLSVKFARPDSPEQVEHQFAIKQLEMGSHDTCITAVNEGYGLGANAWSLDREKNAWSSDRKKQVIFGGLAIFLVLEVFNRPLLITRSIIPSSFTKAWSRQLNSWLW